MKLLLDIGNSRLKWASAEGLKLQQFGRAKYGPEGLSHTLRRLEPAGPPSSIHVSSVVGTPAEKQVEAWATERWDIQPVFVHSQARSCGVTNAYARPEKLGVDRWMAIIAAHHRGAGSACVVDAGTALTVDAISAEGMHQGGLIMPGVTSMRMILDERTQLSLPMGHGDACRLGKDTDEAIASGTLQSILALVGQVYQRLATEMGEQPRAILTGGEAEWLHSDLGGDWVLAPHLVLEGLAISAASTEN